VLAFARWSRERDRVVVCVCNFSPVPRDGYKLGLPRGGAWREAINTDSTYYGGSNVGNLGTITAVERPSHDQDWSAELVLRRSASSGSSGAAGGAGCDGALTTSA